MTLDQINEMTKLAYDRTGQKYHEHFKDEMNQKEFDRFILDQFAEMLPPNSLICDAGCGPSGQTGKYLFDKGHRVMGIDLSTQCIGIAKDYHPSIDFKVMDMSATDFEEQSLDGIVSFYSIIHTPKQHVGQIIAEFNRILKEKGKVVLVVKKGREEGIIDDEWYEGNPIHFTHFLEKELTDYFENNDFTINYFHIRKPYEFEFAVDRIYLIATKNASE